MLWMQFFKHVQVRTYLFHPFFLDIGYRITLKVQVLQLFHSQYLIRYSFNVIILKIQDSKRLQF